MRFILLPALAVCLLIGSCAKTPEETSKTPASQAVTAKVEPQNLPPGAPPEKIIFEAKNGDVTFDHRKHYERVGSKCDTCHPKIFPQALEPLNYKKANHRVAETTYMSCGACHSVGGTAFAADSNCIKCHVKNYN